jgi:dinuclear metal center YbgI/SA1388 family protein
MPLTIEDIVALIDTIAPPQLAEDWDNVGLQTGSLKWPVAKIWVALEPSLNVVRAACRDQATLLITHHPLLFRPLARIDCDSVVGQIIQLCLKHRLGIFTAHTNYDAVRGGLNDVLAQHIELRHCRPLAPAKQFKKNKVCVYLPADRSLQLPNGCPAAIQYIVHGNPFHVSLGQEIEPSKAADLLSLVTFKQKQPDCESWLCHEFIVSDPILKSLLSQLQPLLEAHGGCYHIHPLLPDDPEHGIGRVGVLEPSCKLQILTQRLQTTLDLNNIKAAGDPEMVVDTVALCTGSGSSLLKQFIASRAQVYISGDLRYHEACAVKEKGKGLIDIGHFGSEILIVKSLTAQIQTRLSQLPDGDQVTVKECTIEKDPFWH